MNMVNESLPATIRPVDEFSLRPAPFEAKPAACELLHRGRAVAPVRARLVEAQFRYPDGSTLVLASDDTAFHESLTVLLVGPDLRVRDKAVVGGATTPGFLAYAEPHGPDGVAFCWHDREHLVRVRRRRAWHGLRTKWLSLRDLVPQRDRSARKRTARR